MNIYQITFLLICVLVEKINKKSSKKTECLKKRVVMKYTNLDVFMFSPGLRTSVI